MQGEYYCYAEKIIYTMLHVNYFTNIIQWVLYLIIAEIFRSKFESIKKNSKLKAEKHNDGMYKVCRSESSLIVYWERYQASVEDIHN